MNYEKCFSCGELTGRAGIYDDSIYDEMGKVPFCVECFESYDAKKSKRESLNV